MNQAYSKEVQELAGMLYRELYPTQPFCAIKPDFNQCLRDAEELLMNGLSSEEIS